MISALIDKLREMADQLQEHGTFVGFGGTTNTDPLMHGAAIVMRDAADTIWQLRDDLQRANDAVLDAEHDESRAWDRVRKAEAENAKLKALCEWLLEPYRLGAITGEGVDKQWCRETYDGGSYRLRELGVDDG